MAVGSLQNVQHTYHTRILLLKYTYELYFIVRVSSNSGPLDEQKLDC